MSRTRQWTAVGIVGVLALALGLLWRSQNTAAPTTTSSSTSTTALAAVTTTTSVATTASPTTTSADQRVTEVEAILTDLWFGWLDAIYRKDVNALWDVVATTPYYDAGVTAMDALVFQRAPSQDAIAVSATDVLLDRDDCLVVFYTIDLGGTLDEPPTELVSVMWPDNRYGLRFATQWFYPEDLWLADCDEVVREVTP